MGYILKDKVLITKEFLNDLETKSWQEIEHLQNQIANIEITPETVGVIKLLKSLLTSYYVFIGGLENLADIPSTHKVRDFSDKVYTEKDQVLVNIKEPVKKIESELYTTDDIFESFTVAKGPKEAVSEPFEYFVDFEEPIGDPISDEDLYGN